ncbi:Sec14p-like phosphatidylinositol transfer family protein [Perilla frutescens var. hirtella]|nr:Sec14p-like phosphatidylinositol transfer family protein [Perilla frutescens var. hirtella]
MSSADGKEDEDGSRKENVEESEKGEPSNSSAMDQKSGEEFISDDLKEYEKKALIDLRSKLEDAILSNKLFKKVGKKDIESPTEKREKERHHHHHHHHRRRHHESKENIIVHDDGGNHDHVVDKGKAKVDEREEVEEEEEEEEEEEYCGEVDRDISLWGVPLLPSKGHKSTDVLLLKFLRAKDFKAGEALEMLKSTLEWRKESKIDSVKHEDFGSEYDSVSFMKGLDREGHPVCYNVYGVFANEEIYNKTFGSEGGRERFLRWRLQLLEKEIQKLDFSAGGISTLLQVNDLKDTPGPSRRDLRHATKKAVAILQDNYPEFVSRNIFINVPFWYYAFNALLSPFLTQTTKSKFVFSRPTRVTETLVKYIAAEEIPITYGGLLREGDPEFSTKDVASEIVVKAGATETIEIPAPEIGRSLIWDLTIVGWDVNYKEEFVPSDEASYTMIVKKQRKISWQQEPIRNCFTNKEAGKLVITIENGMFKKKRVLYRFKIKNHT